MLEFIWIFDISLPHVGSFLLLFFDPLSIPDVVFNFSYLLSDNGTLSASELTYVFKTSLSAMNKSYKEDQIQEIVEALWEDMALDSHKDELEIKEVIKMFSAHEGLNEGLTKR